MLRELYDALERANTNIALAHDNHCNERRGLSIDLCPCPLATNWRGNREAMKLARVNYPVTVDYEHPGRVERLGMKRMSK